MKEDREDLLNQISDYLGGQSVKIKPEDHSKAIEATESLAVVIVSFYKSMTDSGVPEDLASAMTMMLLSTILSGGSGSGEEED